MGSEELRFVIKARDEASKVLRDFGGNLRGLGGHFHWLQTIGSKAWHGLVRGAKWAAAAIVAVLGMALVKGFKRLTSIEDAEAKLRGLGQTAGDVKIIMQNALDAVLGTAYGLDEAATIAASAVAAGIKPGKELEKYLRLTADAASIMGTNMADAGSILNQVTAGGRAMRDDLNQLADRGIPILGWLADEYGVTGAKMREMVSEGAVDARTFRRVLEEHIGGAAQDSGKTTTGAFKNMMAALSRFGAVLLKDIFPLAKVVFGGITGLLDDLSKKIGPYAAKFSKGFVRFLNSEGVKQFVADVMDAFQRLWAALTSKKAKQFASDVLGGIIDVAKTLMPIIRDLAERGFNALADAFEFVRKHGDLVKALLVGIAAGFAAFQGIGAVGAIIAAVGGAIAAVSSPIALIVLVIGALAAGFYFLWTRCEWFRNLWIGLWEIVKSAALAAWPTIKVIWGEFQTTLSSVADRVKGFASAVAAVIGWVVDFIREHWGTIGPIVRNVWTVVEAYVTTALKVIAETIGLVMAVIRGDWSGAWGHVKAIVRAAWTGIKTVVKGSLSLILALLKAGWSVMKAVASAAWNGLVSVVKGAVGRLVSVAKGIPGKIKNALGNLGDLLLQAGRNLIQGLISGITGKLQDLWNTLSGVKDKIAGFIHFSYGPLYPIGQKLMAGLTAGIAASVSDLQRQMNAVALAASPQLSPSFAFAGSAYSAAANYPAAPAVATPASATAPVGAGAGTDVYVFLDSEPIAARVEVRQQQKARRSARLTGAF